MRISNLLKEMGVEAVCVDEKDFMSLGLAAYNDAKSEVCTFIDDEKYIESITENVRMVLVKNQVFDILRTRNRWYGMCIVDNPRATFFMLHNFLAKSGGYNKTSEEAKIGENTSIHNYASISDKNVVIGNNVIIEEFVVIKENTVIGDNTIIRAGCKIGGGGFEFKRNGSGILSVEHVGRVIIGKNVEIKYNTCIDKAIYPWDYTMIGDYTKIDNLVHVGHAAKIGKRCMIVANSGIGGRVSIGDDVWVGFGATIRNGLKIGNNARANMGAVVTKDIGDAESFTGNFAVPHEEFIRNLTRV